MKPRRWIALKMGSPEHQVQDDFPLHSFDGKKTLPELLTSTNRIWEQTAQMHNFLIQRDHARDTPEDQQCLRELLQTQRDLLNALTFFLFAAPPGEIRIQTTDV